MIGGCRIENSTLFPVVSAWQVENKASVIVLSQKKYLILLVSMSCFPVALNGYPLVHFDTGNYSTSFQNISSFYAVPVDRPIFYGIYVWFVSMFGATLRLVPLSQALIFAWLLIGLMRVRYEAHFGGLAFCALLLIVGTSYVPFLVSAVMPDVWTGLMALACMVWMIKTDGDFRTDGACYVIIASAIAFAPANALILGLSLVPFAFRLKRTADFLRVAFLIFSMLLPLGLCTVTNYLTFHDFKIVKGSQAYLFARLAADKNLAAAIENECTRSSEALICRNRDIIEGKTHNEILWTDISEKLDIWKDPRGETARLVKAALQENFVTILFTAFQDTLKTLLSIPHSLSELYAGPFGADAFVSKTIKAWYPNDLPRFAASIQQSNPNFYLVQHIFLICAVSFWFGAFAAVGRIAYGFYRKAPLDVLCGFAISFAVANAFVCSLLSGFDFRYNVKGASLPLLVCAFALGEPLLFKSRAGRGG